jgi:hypothetical protein
VESWTVLVEENKVPTPDELWRYHLGEIPELMRTTRLEIGLMIHKEG